MKKLWFFLFISLIALLGCGERAGGGLDGLISALNRTGRLPDADLSDIPQDIEYDIDVSSLPDYVSLESKFPPIGDQGNYGTCVAWAAGYNLKTALNSIDENWSALDLENASNQTALATSVAQLGEPNAYTPQEIESLLKKIK